MAWSFISAASSLCITLRYHRTPASNDLNDVLQADRERLFWTVYAIDKALALRLGRLSNISDSEVTLSIDRCDIREAKLARVQGKVYEQLYSPEIASHGDLGQQRSRAAEVLADATQDLIRQTNAEISVCAIHQSCSITDMENKGYLKTA
jgi:hypothetical protein